jgi:hypothetical protein
MSALSRGVTGGAEGTGGESFIFGVIPGLIIGGESGRGNWPIALALGLPDKAFDAFAAATYTVSDARWGAVVEAASSLSVLMRVNCSVRVSEYEKS